MSNKRIKLEDGEVYKYSKSKGFSLYDPFSFTYKGYTIKKLYELNENRKKLLDKIDEYKEKVLLNYNEAYGDTLFEILDNLTDNHKLYILSSDKVYQAFEIDREGYIKNALEGKFSPVELNLPSDLTKGYYKIKGGKLFRDKRREEELWNL